MSERINTEELSMWLDEWSELPKQGTPEWDILRGVDIGNSELEQLERQEHQIALLKCKLKKRPDVLAMRWGSFVEIICRTFASHYFNCQIYEASSLPSAECKNKRCSPDGLAVVSLPVDNKFITFTDEKSFAYTRDLLKTLSPEQRKWMKILFEFKSLFSRMPDYGIIPHHYKSQVLGGLADLQILEKCIYIECVVKFATLEQILPCLSDETTNKKLDIKEDVLSYTAIHYDPNFEPTRVLGIGFIALYNPESKDIDANAVNDELLKTYSKWFELFGLVKTHDISQYCCYIDADDEKRVAILNDELAKVKKMPGVIGIMYYKLFDVNIVAANYQKGYTTAFAPLITRCVQNVKKINASTNKVAEYNKIYGRSLSPNLDDFQ